MTSETKKTMKELGEIILASSSTEEVSQGYDIDASDVAEVGRAALLWGDISPDGELN